MDSLTCSRARHTEMPELWDEQEIQVCSSAGIRLPGKLLVLWMAETETWCYQDAPTVQKILSHGYKGLGIIYTAGVGLPLCDCALGFPYWSKKDITYFIFYRSPHYKCRSNWMFACRRTPVSITLQKTQVHIDQRPQPKTRESGEWPWTHWYGRQIPEKAPTAQEPKSTTLNPTSRTEKLLQG